MPSSKAASDTQAVLAVREADIPFEEDVLRNRYSLKSWVRYLEFKKGAPPRERHTLHERALAELPGSYKLWKSYLEERLQEVNGMWTSRNCRLVNSCFDRALSTMHKMPRVWIMYCEALIAQRQVTFTRRTFDRALQALPITQHSRIWDLYLPWVRKLGIPETAVRVQRRHLKLEPGKVEDFIDYLIDVGMLAEAAERLSKVLSDEFFQSSKGKSRHQLWLQLCDIIANHPESTSNLKVEGILRQGLASYTDMSGKLWTALANYFARLGNFEKARDVFEEGLSTVMTVRDFAHIWEAYTQFEDGLITAHLEHQQSSTLTAEEEMDFDMRIARYEYLIDRRPLLLSSVMLRQNPHNVFEWLKRARLYSDPRNVVETYQRALRTVNPLKATGKIQSLWINFARYYENPKSHHRLRGEGEEEETQLGTAEDDEEAPDPDLEAATMIFEKATEAKYKSVDDLASLWCAYVEFELRNQNYEQGRRLLRRATQPPLRIKRLPPDSPMQAHLYKNTRLWCFYADIEESLGTFESTRAVYEEMISLRVVTPQIMLNYAQYLWEKKYFEDAFRAYEKGVANFSFPYSLDIWLCYLTKFVERYGGSKLERARDIFEQAIEKVPKDLALPFYVLYAELEEKYGLARHAMNIYHRATKAVQKEDQMKIFKLYIKKATEYFGVTRTREIYEKAITVVEDSDVRTMCLSYADLEQKLGEIDRARAIYTHCSQFCDPRSDNAFWELWKSFEIRHGNEDTFREMLRIRWSVEQQYNTQVNLATVKMGERVPEGVKRGRAEDEMQQLERMVAATVPEDGAPVKKPRVEENPEEISLDDDETEEMAAEEEAPKPKKAPRIELEQMEVPDAVFGSAKGEVWKDKDKAEAEEKPKKKMGALERMKAKSAK